MTGYDVVLLEPRDNLILPWPLEEPRVLWFGESSETDEESEFISDLTAINAVDKFCRNPIRCGNA